MKNIISFLILFSVIINAQTIKKTPDLSSPGSIKSFADYLFCQHDYLRAIEEYKRYLGDARSDTVEFKIGEAYAKMGYYSEAAKTYSDIQSQSSIGKYARLNYLKSLFQTNDFKLYRSSFNKLNLTEDTTYYREALSLYNFSFLLSTKDLPGEDLFLKPFTGSDREKLSEFYKYKSGLPHKSPVAAAIFSAIIPGAGKFYTEDYADGVVAFIATAALSYIAYTDFGADHKFRAWLFTGLAAGFYAGNIYGSAASAQLFNVKIDFDFVQNLKSYLEKVNYFVPIINFCK